jgi:cytochrome c nitrite reductase small subunit
VVLVGAFAPARTTCNSLHAARKGQTLKLFKKKTNPSVVVPGEKKKTNWFKISIIANIVIILGIGFALISVEIIHQSDTNPAFCKTCHLMDSHVDSYLNGNTLDNVHAQAGVQCKECHSEYKIPQEIASGIKFITGNYDPELPRRKYGDENCLQCHISMDHLADQTDYLERNPHLSHFGDLACRTCHISHGEQIDYCGQCHDNGGQRMTGGEIIPRAVNPLAPGSE